MIRCAQCGKKNKDDATVCKHCGYNPNALAGNAWDYQQDAYPQTPYQNNQVYYDAQGNAYNVQYNYNATPVYPTDYGTDYDEDENGQMLLYPYNPATQQQIPAQKQKTAPNPMAIVGYVLAMLFDILAWPFCLIGLSIAKKREDAKKEWAEAGMLFTLLRLVTLLFLFLVWLFVSLVFPTFFEASHPLKLSFIKILFMGWPIAVGSMFIGFSKEGSALRLAGKGYFFFSIATAVLILFFFDPAILPLFA